ncbi:MAG: hypothetical protein OER88_00215 [Planctomycetota bacterium]|nr:hypothetical protein [Planctomycetota bacterium]
MADARRAAVSTLVEIARRRSTARDVWTGPRDAAETAIVLGVLRRRGTLDAILRQFCSRRLHLLKPETLASLRAGVFELLFLDGSPSYAVVNAAVENVKAARRMRDLGLVNAVLRSVLRDVARVEQPTAPVDRHHLGRPGAVWRFKTAVWPDPGRDPAKYLAARASTAEWIAARRLDELGFERALHALEVQASPPPIRLRVAPGREDDVAAALSAAGVEFERGRLFTLAPQARMSDVLAACGALVAVQDSVASLVAPFCGVAPGQRALDLCAAPGGKATHLAQLGADVTAWDKDPERLEKVAENAARLGLENLSCGEPEGEYDVVLADVPCSNTGVLARRPEARWRVKERHLAGMAERQLSILRRAAGHVTPSGTLVYSTCSLEREENRGVVDEFLRVSGDFGLDEAVTCYPDEHAGDGGFMARLRRV